MQVGTLELYASVGLTLGNQATTELELRLRKLWFSGLMVDLSVNFESKRLSERTKAGLCRAKASPRASTRRKGQEAPQKRSPKTILAFSASQHSDCKRGGNATLDYR